MQDLQLIGVHEDGEHLLLSGADGERFQMPIDDALRAADRRPQRVVDRHLETLTVGSAEQQVLAVLMHADQLQVLHRLLLSRPLTTDSAIISARASAGHAARVVLAKSSAAANVAAPVSYTHLRAHETDS